MGKHIFVCTGSKCAPETSPSVYQYLKDRVKELGLGEKIQRSQCHCLGICKDGPIVVVYPEGVWYSHLDQTKLERVIQEHLIDERPVQEYRLH